MFKGKFWVVMVMVLAGLFFCMSAGCLHAPKGTVAIDTDGDGNPDALALDLNLDGIPDTNQDAGGAPIIVEGSGVYKYASIVDDLLPTILGLVGGITGLKVLNVLGIWWKAGKPGRLTANLVMSIQAARKKLSTDGPEGALAILDEILTTAQDPETIEFVANIKKTMGIKSVT